MAGETRGLRDQSSRRLRVVGRRDESGHRGIRGVCERRGHSECVERERVREERQQTVAGTKAEALGLKAGGGTGAAGC